MSNSDTWGVTLYGFRRPSYDELLAETYDDMRTLFGPDVDVSSSSPLGQIAQVIARKMAKLWAELEFVYDAAFIDSARGNNLEKLVAITGSHRNAATHATGEVVFSRTTSAVRSYDIPLGTTVATADRSLVFFTTAATEIPEGSTQSTPVPVRAVETGLRYNLAPGTVVAITSPVIGVESVTNPTLMSGGSNVESDAAFRSRVKMYMPAATATPTAIETALWAIEGVIEVYLVEDKINCNWTVYVSGGDSDIITSEVERIRAAGIAAFWSRPESATINVTATIRGDITMVTEALRDYLQNLPMGSNVPYSTLISVASSAPGSPTIYALSAQGLGQTASQLGQAITIPEGAKTTTGTISVQELT